MQPELLEALRQDLVQSGYTESTAGELVTDELIGLVTRGVLYPAIRKISTLPLHEQAAPKVILTRLFVLGDAITIDELFSAFPRLGLEAVTLGLLTEFDASPKKRFRAALSLTPMTSPGSGEHWWILSDLDDHLRFGPALPDHVMGIGGATRSLIDAFPRSPVQNALEIGTGCGVVALVLSEFVEHVHATDLSERALTFSRANAVLNRRTNIDFLSGNLFEPVTGKTFDLIVSNPPFVISPEHSAEPQYTYRSSSAPGDTLLRRFVNEAPRHLTPGGTCVSLANWEFVWGGPDGSDLLSDRLGTEFTGFAWFIERARQTPVEYASLWLRDGGLRESDPEFGFKLQRWVEDFQLRHVSRIIFGYLMIVNTSDVLSPRYGSLHSQLGAVERFGDVWATTAQQGITVSQLSDEQLCSRAFTRHKSVEEVRTFVPGTEDLTSISFVRRDGIERFTSADTVEAALLGASDGELTIQQITDALAELLEFNAVEHLPEIVATVRENVWKGFLEL